MAGEKILVIDDDATIRKMVSCYLANNGFQVFTSVGGYNVVEQVRNHKPDLIILDILLPDLDGIEICREIRRETNTPVIYLTSKDDPSDIVLGLGIGGDDYITKPFNPVEMLARVKAVLRRSRLQNPACNPVEQKQLINYHGLEVDIANRVVQVDGTPVSLTNKEFELFSLLVQNPGRVFNYHQLFELVWQLNDIFDHRTIVVHINRLRKKIEPDYANPRYIITVRGIGYKFNGI